MRQAHPARMNERARRALRRDGGMACGFDGHDAAFIKVARNARLTFVSVKPLPAARGEHRRPTDAVLYVKNADAKHRLCERSERGGGGLSAILSPADRPPHPNPLPASGEREP